jgi:hypothetical protein
MAHQDHQLREGKLPRMTDKIFHFWAEFLIGFGF